MYRLRKFRYKIRSKTYLQFIKHSWLDMKRDKTKVIFGVLGIAISIFLLTAIGYLNDTMGYNYIQTATNTTGNSDILVTETIQTDLSFDPFFPETIIETNLQDVPGVEGFFPRILAIVDASSDNSNQSSSFQMYGIDFDEENDNGHMGHLAIVDDNGVETGEIYDDDPDSGECVILWNIAEFLNLSRDDTIHLDYNGELLDLIVTEICVQKQKFMEFETALILVTINQAQTFLDQDGFINYIAGVVTNRELVYDARNIQATTARLRTIANLIQDRLDINEYTIALPKLSELETAEFTLMTMTIMFWFIMILSMLITGILINGILSTSVEERVREFGVIRVVGSKRSLPIKMVLFEGFMLGLLGSTIGLALGLISTPFIAGNIFSLFQMESTNINYIILPETVIIAFSIGTLVSLVISLLPAIKTARIDLIKAITPFQTKEEGWEIKKEGSMNTKSFLVGIAIATIGLIIFVLLPQIFTTGNMTLISTLFIGLLAAILIGLVFASVGIVPLLQRIFLGIISPGIRKYSSIIKISFKRYGRRNTSTVVMFAISFSFIFFITGMSQMQSENMSLTLRFQYGADLVILNQGEINTDSAVDLEMYETIKNLEGIKKSAFTVHNTFDLTAIFSLFFDTSSGISSDSEESIMNLIGYYASELSSKFSVTAGDTAGEHDSVDIGIIGINDSFVDLIDKNLLVWGSLGSDTEYSFNQLFAHNNTCIIAQSIATRLSITEVGQQIFLTFFPPGSDVGVRQIFTVAGISGGIPGYWNFRSGEMTANGGGVMLSAENYMRLMEIQNPNELNMTVDKIFINLDDISEQGIQDMKDHINTLYTSKSFVIDDAISKINFMNEMSARQSLIMEIILMFTVLICIFGLISSMYAVMIERTFEIGILRSMGMKVRNVRNMFLIESMIIMISAGIMGTVIGTFTAWLLQTNMSLLTEMPTIFSIPYLTLFRVFSISIAVGFIGIYVILWRLSRQTIMDIFRQTF